MKGIILSLAPAFLTFAVGLASANLFAILTSEQPELSLVNEDASPINLADEAVLRGNLSRLRKLIDQYHEDRGGYSLERGGSLRSLDDLVRAGYLRELPVDPMTGERDWQPEGFGCPSEYGFYFFDITGVRSKSSAISSGGKPYSEW